MTLHWLLAHWRWSKTVVSKTRFTLAGIEGSDDEALDAGQDEEVSRWEQEQIRKGISIPQVSRKKYPLTFYDTSQWIIYEFPLRSFMNY